MRYKIIRQQLLNEDELNNSQAEQEQRQQKPEMFSQKRGTELSWCVRTQCVSRWLDDEALVFFLSTER